MEEERKRKQSATPCISNAPDLIDPKPNPNYTSSHKEDTPIPSPEKETQTIRKRDMSKFKTPVARKLMSSQPMPQLQSQLLCTIASTTVATTTPSSDKTCKRLGLPCPFCTQFAPYPHQ